MCGTVAAVVDDDGTRAVDKGQGQFATLAVAGVGIGWYGGVEGGARGVGVEVEDCCGEDGGDGVVQMQQED